ncbi:hypothetical protein KI688_010017 [Linnemannia hyalina]|uniref:Uncharacterized protein n=1 Tax=Linnemannia hyalina TaxID=64524 RepID=A0A9P7XXU6_9FUNG|nr:hypothetical protein KI688_010017 [Linnemannia hyalina]
MSLDVFKVPFNLNKSRRATCAASDLKRMLTIKTSSVLVRRQQKKADDQSDGSNNGVNNHDGPVDEILKTSRYHPDEQVMDRQGDDDGQQYQNFAQDGQAMEDEDSYRYQHQHAHHQYSNDAAEESFNPFVQHHNNHKGHGQDIAAHPFDSAPDQDTDPYRQPFQATDRPINIDEKKSTNMTRRRYSVFSDWSIEDCPRLLAMQQRQQQQQREEQEQLDRLYQGMSSSQTMLARSTTDTSLGQTYDITQHRRHTTIAHTHHPSPESSTPAPPPAAVASSGMTGRPRRNTVILGKNLIRSATSAAGPNHRRPNPETASLKSTTSRHPATTDAYTASLQRRQLRQQQQQQQQKQHEHGNGQLRQPVGRPESSHSYKHDFLKDTAKWKPHPWTVASSSYSSACSSPSSPLHQSRFPHELGHEESDQDDSDESSSEDDDSGSNSDSEEDSEDDAEPLYHDMKAIQMKPYGHEDDDDDGYSRFEQQAGQEDVGPQEQGYEDGSGGNYGYYDDSFQWHPYNYDQQPDSTGGYYESPSSSAAAFSESTTTPSKAQSQDSLAKKASLAKAKFYKYLSKSATTTSPSSSSQHNYHPLDSGDSDLETTSHHHYQHGFYEAEVDNYDHDSSHHQFGSGYSFTSSLRARVRLTKTKTVLRQVKRRLSEALSEATTKAASTLRHDLHIGKKFGPGPVGMNGVVEMESSSSQGQEHLAQTSR